VANHVRVKELFAAWDLNHDGRVSKKEFRKAFEELGLAGHAEDVNALFGFFDTDGGGSIDVHELDRNLRRPWVDRPMDAVSTSQKGGHAAPGRVGGVGAAALRTSGRGSAAKASHPSSFAGNPNSLYPQELKQQQRQQPDAQGNFHAQPSGSGQATPQQTKVENVASSASTSADKIFASIDTNNDGVLSKEEFTEYMARGGQHAAAIAEPASASASASVAAAAATADQGLQADAAMRASKMRDQALAAAAEAKTAAMQATAAESRVRMQHSSLSEATAEAKARLQEIKATAEAAKAQAQAIQQAEAKAAAETAAAEWAVAEKEKVAALDRLAAERSAADRAKAAAVEKEAAEKAVAEKAAAEKAAAEKAAAVKAVAEKAAAERAAVEKAAVERASAEKAAVEKAAAERAAAQRAAAERAVAERAAAERAAAERAAAERAAAERAAAERAAAERASAERTAAERVAAEKAAAEKARSSPAAIAEAEAQKAELHQQSLARLEAISRKAAEDAKAAERAKLEAERAELRREKLERQGAQTRPSNIYGQQGIATTAAHSAGAGVAGQYTVGGGREAGIGRGITGTGAGATGTGLREERRTVMERSADLARSPVPSKSVAPRASTVTVTSPEFRRRREAELWEGLPSADDPISRAATKAGKKAWYDRWDGRGNSSPPKVAPAPKQLSTKGKQRRAAEEKRAETLAPLIDLFGRLNLQGEAALVKGLRRSDAALVRLCLTAEPSRDVLHSAVNESGIDLAMKESECARLMRWAIVREQELEKEQRGGAEAAKKAEQRANPARFVHSSAP
jgi:Ca2+-binding EF-hand superfamily protein